MKLSLYQAPTTTLSLAITTELPKLSPAAVSAAVSVATWSYVAPPSLVRKTYAEPESVLSSVPASSLPTAPTTMVSPSMSTDQPKPSSFAASAAVSFATWS